MLKSDSIRPAGSYRELRDLVEPEVIGTLSRYLRRLIIEQPYIRARLENPGGSILLMPTSNPDQVSYGTEIGNDAHLDLIEANMVMDGEFSQGERDTIEQWALGFTSQQAAEYNHVKAGAIRKRRERVLDKLEGKLDGRIEPRGTSDGDTAQIGQSPQTGHLGRQENETGAQEGTESRGDAGKAT